MVIFLIFLPSPLISLFHSKIILQPCSLFWLHKVRSISSSFCSPKFKFSSLLVKCNCQDIFEKERKLYLPFLIYFREYRQLPRLEVQLLNKYNLVTWFRLKYNYNFWTLTKNMGSLKVLSMPVTIICKISNFSLLFQLLKSTSKTTAITEV